MVDAIAERLPHLVEKQLVSALASSLFAGCDSLLWNSSEAINVNHARGFRYDYRRTGGARRYERANSHLCLPLVLTSHLSANIFVDCMTPEAAL